MINFIHNPTFLKALSSLARINFKMLTDNGIWISKHCRANKLGIFEKIA